METNELMSLLRDRLSISVNVDTEWDSCGEYASFSVSLNFTDNDGKTEEISSDYGSVRINSND